MPENRPPPSSSAIATENYINMQNRGAMHLLMAIWYGRFEYFMDKSFCGDPSVAILKRAVDNILIKMSRLKN